VAKSEPTPEGRLKIEIIAWLKTIRHCEVFPVLMSRVHSRRSSNRLGTPDLTLCYRGRFVGVELKSPDGVQSPKQIEVGEAINGNGQGVYVVVRTLKDLKDELHKIAIYAA